ncbi:hypothetical protein D0Y65_023381 [Glycine soja]|nr:hypothetical protein D0Y65_023381 [Glycine soja]
MRFGLTTGCGMEETVDLRNGVELATSVSDKHLDLLRPSARNYSIFRGQAMDVADHEKGNYTLIKGPEDFQTGLYDKPLPCYGCGIGWFSFLFGFLCPPLWYYATILYFGNYYRKDPRERAGLGASAIAALICSVALLIVGAILMLRYP